MLQNFAQKLIVFRLSFAFFLFAHLSVPLVTSSQKILSLAVKSTSELNYIEFLPRSQKNASISLFSLVETWLFARLSVFLWLRQEDNHARCKKLKQAWLFTR
ncbi:MAG: hypothetical protein IKL03_01075 [Bacteroidaceae bacterium]|nr:hypothetical protein [Bacteroidaceae bacterium]